MVVHVEIGGDFIAIPVTQGVDVDVGIKQADPDPRRWLGPCRESVVTAEVVTIELSSGW